jgi:hypothetical protein
VSGPTFLGFPAGTLLVVGIGLTRYRWTLKPDANAFPAAAFESDYLYEVEILCSYFSPTRGFTGPGFPVAQITTDLGHNNFIYAGAPNPLAAGSDRNSMMWFLATADGTKSGGRLFGATQFEQMFNSPQNVVTATLPF